MQSTLYGLAMNGAEASAAARANLSPRARQLETLEKYANGTQYDGLADWFDDEPPLWERAPCIVYNLVGVAIRSNGHLVLGEGRFPVITSNPGENDSEAGGLDEEVSKSVDRGISELHKRTRFRSICRQALKHAQQAKSCAVVVGVRGGKPAVEVIRSWWCEPTFDIQRNVIKLEVRYPYCEWEKLPDGKWKLHAKLFRRIIDAVSDTTFISLEAEKAGREPPPDAWKPDPTKTVKHGLGFCPVLWYGFMRECAAETDYDGTAIHQEVLDECRGLDFALSQRHRSALFCGDPQIIETGVEAGYNPSGQWGKTGSIPSTYAGGEPSKSNPVTGRFQQTGQQAARKKSPGVVWQYESPTTKVGYLMLPADALGVLESHISDLRNKLAEMLCVVILDPQNVKNTADMSGKAIEQLRARQFDRCDEIREDVEENLLLPLTKLLIRVALKANVKIKAVQAVAKELAAFAEDGAELMLFTRWPTGYVKPDPADEQAIVTMATTAVKGGVATRRMALEKVAPIFGIDSVDQAEEALEKERQANMAEQQEAMSALHGDENDDGDGGPTGKKPAGSGDRDGGSGSREA